MYSEKRITVRGDRSAALEAEGKTIEVEGALRLRQQIRLKEAKGLRLKAKGKNVRGGRIASLEAKSKKR